ncbi:MAG: hypothetical protein Ta2G_12590 [Termitinemataceae bacterium]|nr:MAG: hypothetical protein Ta2G_12590 [Termitinemataceae bacterium]
MVDCIIAVVMFNMLIPIHFERDCIYNEADAVSFSNYDLEININKMLDFLRKENFPSHYGLNETNIIYRKHNTKEIISMMDMWWTFIENYSKRDQLSLSYVLWKHNVDPSDISFTNARFDEANFKVYVHKH